VARHVVRLVQHDDTAPFRRLDQGRDRVQGLGLVDRRRARARRGLAVHAVERDERLLFLPDEGLHEPELVEDELVLVVEGPALGPVEGREVAPRAHVQVDGDGGVDGRCRGLEQDGEEHGVEGYVRARAALFGRLRRKDEA
jgi:hypothetical protein